MLKKKKEVQEKKVVMYIGPTIPGLISTSTVFRNGIPSAVSAKAKECPSLLELLVPIENVAEKTKEIQNGKGASSVFYQDVCSFFFNKK